MADLKLLSYNIQVGIDSHHFSHYVTRSWRHVFPSKQRQSNLHSVSKILKDYDIVALQEVDGGSLRSGFINQVQYLGDIGQFNAWYHQCNRNLGKIAQQSNGILCRYPVTAIVNHKLPGRIPGRGAIEAVLGNNENTLAIYVVHLSLGKKARAQQLNYLSKITKKHKHIIIMGDMNMLPIELHPWTDKNHLTIAGEKEGILTYPSWEPATHIDHILVSDHMHIKHAAVLPFRYSDHLPIAVTVEIPSTILNQFADQNTEINPLEEGLINE